MKINYVVGDATAPIGGGIKIIPHVCNDIGAWGAGFVMALSAKWKTPEREYRKWHHGGVSVDFFGNRENFSLGSIQCVNVGCDIFVVNMIAQHGIYSRDGIEPIRYPELKTCLDKVAVLASNIGGSIHAPMFGSGLAGGDWNKIATMIEESFVANPVTVYEYKKP